MSLASFDGEGSARLFRLAHELGKITATDFCCLGEGVNRTSEDWTRLLAPMLKECDLALPSQVEAKRLTGSGDPRAVRERLSGCGIKVLVVKLGAKGCYVTDFKNEWTVPAFSEFKAVDSTGAGDSFGAGFVRAYLEGWPLPECAIFANVVAGFNVTKIGATAGVPDFETARNYARAHGATLA
jgi:sugar/nucleoside kinase (ribokinase family)